MRDERFLALVILGFCSYRVTRFLIIDTLIQGPRQKFHIWLANRQKAKPLFDSILELTSCAFCMGFWVSLAVFAIYRGNLFTHWVRLDWLSAIAVAGEQALIQAIEPDRE